MTAQVEVVPQSGHVGEVSFAAYSPDNRYLYSISEDGTAICWDLNTSRMLKPLRGLKPGEKAESLYFVSKTEYLVRTNSEVLYYGDINSSELLPYDYLKRTMYKSEGCAYSEYFLALVPGASANYKLVLYFPFRKKESRVYYSPDVEKLVTSSVRSLHYSKSQNALFIGDNEGNVIVMDAATKSAYVLKRFKETYIRSIITEGNRVIVVCQYKKGFKKVLYWIDLHPKKKKAKKVKLLKDECRVVFLNYDSERNKFIISETNPNTFCSEIRYFGTPEEYKTASIVYTGKYNQPINVVAMSPDGNYMAMFPYNNICQIYKLKDNEIVQTMHRPVYSVSDFRWDPQSRKMYIYNSQSMTYSVVDFENVDFKSYVLPIKRETTHHFMPDGTFIISDNKAKYLFRCRPNGLIDSVLSPFSLYFDFESNDEHKLLLGQNKDGYLSVFSTDQQKVVYTIPFEPGMLSGSFKFTSSRNHIWATNINFIDDDTVYFYNALDGRPAGYKIKEKMSPDSIGVVVHFDLSQDGEKLYVATRRSDYDNDTRLSKLVIVDFKTDNVLKVIDLPGEIERFQPGRKKGEVLLQMKLLDGTFRFGFFNEATMSVSVDQTVFGSLTEYIQWNTDRQFWSFSNVVTEVFRGQTGDLTIRSLGSTKPDYQLVSNNKGYVLLASNGTLFGTKGSSDFLAYQYKTESGWKTVPGSVYEAYSNKPHVVLKDLNLANENTIKTYESAYNKRLSRMDSRFEFGDSKDLPWCEIALIEGTLNTKSNLHLFTLQWKSKRPLKHVYMEHNGTLINYDTAIRNAADGKGNCELLVKLIPGLNRVTFYVTDDLGLNSLPDYREISVTDNYWNYSTTYYIGIGVSQYQDHSFNLNYAAKDIRDLAAQIEKGDYVMVDTFLNEQALWDSIVTVKERLGKLGPEDKVVISFSGHGLLSKNLDLYLGLYNMDFDNPEINGLRIDSLIELLNSSRALHKILLLDACHSGEIDKEGKILVSGDSLASGARGSNIVLNKNARKVDVFTFMKNHFEDGVSHNGAVVISAAGGEEYALELHDLANGVFTHVLLKCLSEKEGDINKDGQISVSELRDYVLKKVPELTRNRQQPTVRSENQVSDWILWGTEP